MIQLVGVLAAEGIPVRIRTYVDVESATVLGGIVEVLKGLSAELQLGRVRRLEFQDKTLLVTESEKGYSVVALAEKAEDYVEGLLRVIRIAMDNSKMPPVTEPVSEETRTKVDAILDFHLQRKLDVKIEEVIDPVWGMLYEQIRQTTEYDSALSEIDEMIRASKDPDENWEALEAKAKGSLEDAVNLALAGKFDHACAICLRLDDPFAQLFAVKLGLLALSMTHTAAPSIYELRRIAETLPLKYRPYSELAYAATLYADRLMSYSDFLKIYQSTAERFEFDDHLECQIFAFLFIDTKVVTLPEFARKLAAYFKEKSPIIHSYILAMLDREQLFTKLYSITSYDEFKDQVSLWKTKISSILDDVKQFLKPGFIGKLLRNKPEAGLTGSLNLGTYIALYTALAESPVLNLSERKEVLEEVLTIYGQYFRKLLQSQLSLFAYTVDSVFQSVSVVLGEMYYLLTRKEQKEHIDTIKRFLQDVLDVASIEWLRKHPDTSTLFVMSNATFPVLLTENRFDATEIRFIYLAMRLLNTMALMKEQELHPQDFVTDLLNIKTSLVALIAKLPENDRRNQIMEQCIRLLLQGHKFFITHGVLCRDDIASATLLTSQLISTSTIEALPSFVDSAIALNRIAVPDIERHESDIAVLATPYLTLLTKAAQYLKGEKYVKLAKVAFDDSLQVWKKFGFDFKADEFREQFPQLVG